MTRNREKLTGRNKRHRNTHAVMDRWGSRCLVCNKTVLCPSCHPEALGESACKVRAENMGVVQLWCEDCRSEKHDTRKRPACPTPSKLSFRSRKKAMNKVRKLNVSPTLTSSLEVYECRCGEWHLTKKNRRNVWQ